MTYKQAKDNLPPHIAALHPAACGRRSKEAELVALYAGPAQPSKAPKDGMNKLSRRFRDSVLEPAWVRGDIGEYKAESVNLRLAGRTWYRPDWFVTIMSGEHGISELNTLIELKGFMRDDASVKLKVAAAMYPMFRWLLIFKDGQHGWEVREVGHGGIGRNPIIVPWIHGMS